MILLREDGKTQEEIAQLMGVSVSTVNRADAARKARRRAAAQGRRLRIMFADEARFGRMNRPRPCWAPEGVRPQVACQLILEFVYLHGAVCPHDGTCAFLILPAADTECFQIFLDMLAKKHRRSHILLFVDGTGNHKCNDLVVPEPAKATSTTYGTPAFVPHRPR